MELNKLFENISEEYLTDSTKFANWILSLYQQGHLHGHNAVGPFGEELVKKFFYYLLPLEDNAKKEFIANFEDKTFDTGKRSFFMEGSLNAKGTSCGSFRSELIEYIGRIRKEAEVYMYQHNLITKEEISDLFYHLRHNMGGSDVYMYLTGITANVNYYKMHLVCTEEDLENYLQNYEGKEKEFGCKTLEKFKKDKASAL